MRIRPKIASQHETIDEHLRLREELEVIRTALATKQVSRTAIADMMRQLRMLVLEHFRHEERGGYFTGALEMAPHLTHRADDLLGQHPQMADLLAALVDESATQDSGRRWRNEVDERFSKFLTIFLAHEAGEQALLLEAYNDDIGAQD